MGLAASLPAGSAYRPFQELGEGYTSELVRSYQERDLDFGIDLPTTEALTGLDRGQCVALLDSLAKGASEPRLINALALLAGACIAGEKDATSAAARIFDIFDFDARGQISRDELTILLLCSLRAANAVNGSQDEPDDDATELISDAAFDQAIPPQGNPDAISKREFLTWATRALRGVPSAEAFVAAFSCGITPGVDNEETDDAAAKLQARIRGRNERLNPTTPPAKAAEALPEAGEETDLAAAKLQARVRGRNERLHPTAPPSKAVRNAAFVFVKPHAVTPPTIELVKSKLEGAGLTILTEGDISSEDIDEKKLVDQHYYAIASKATITPPAELVVLEDKFQAAFGESWADVLASGRAFTALDACAELGVSGSELNAAWNAAKDKGDFVKLGGGFYCGRLPKGDASIYTFNAFYMAMRDRFTAPGGSVHYFSVEWDASTLAWADFRGTLLGPTDPAKAPPDSIRGTILKDWEALGLNAPPDTGDNGVHASASPFEGLAEKMNWLGVSLDGDAFGAAVLAAGVDDATLTRWTKDPVVQYDAAARGSLFDALEDTDADACRAKLVAFSSVAPEASPPSKPATPALAEAVPAAPGSASAPVAAPAAAEPPAPEGPSPEPEATEPAPEADEPLPEVAAEPDGPVPSEPLGMS